MLRRKVDRGVLGLNRAPSCHLAAQYPTSYRRSIVLLSNILTLDKKTERTAVLLKQGWLTYNKGGYRVLRGNADQYEHKDRHTE
jgi:hypothetical protein